VYVIKESLKGLIIVAKFFCGDKGECRELVFQQGRTFSNYIISDDACMFHADCINVHSFVPALCVEVASRFAAKNRFTTFSINKTLLAQLKAVAHFTK
jgi:hypothetical protein